MKQPQQVSPHYYDARRESFEQVDETCPRVCDFKDNMMHFLLRIIIAECHTKYDFYKNFIRIKLDDELDELKHDTTYKFRDAHVDAIIQKLELKSLCENLQREVSFFSDLARTNHSEVESLKKKLNEKQKELPREIIYQSVTGGVTVRELGNATTLWEKVQDILSHVGRIFARNISTMFRLLTRTTASIITKPTWSQKGVASNEKI